MAELTSQEVDEVVLRVVASQSEGYLIQPDATAFAVEGLSQDAVLESLARLADAEHVRLTQEVGMCYSTEEVTERVGGPLRGKKVTRTELLLDEHGEPILEIAKDEDGNDVIVNEGWEVTKLGAKAGQRLRQQV